MYRSRTVSLVLTALSLWATACTSYRHIEIGEIAGHDKVRVTTTDGERATVHDPRVEADSIKGQVNRGVESADWVARSIPVYQVAELEATGANTVGTVLIIVGSLAVIWFVVGITSDPPPGST